MVMKGDFMKQKKTTEFQLRQTVLASPDLTSTEKIIMTAILMRVDWKTFTGQVSVNVLAEMTSNKERTVKRALKKLIELKWIKRESKRLEYAKSTAALTTVLLTHTQSSVIDDTVTVSQMTPPSVTDDTLSSVKNDTQTISYNSISIQNNNIENESLDSSEMNQFCVNEDENDDFWLYPSSIEDPRKRLSVQSYIQAHAQKLTHLQKQALLFPEISQPVWCAK